MLVQFDATKDELNVLVHQLKETSGRMLMKYMKTTLLLHESNVDPSYIKSINKEFVDFNSVCDKIIEAAKLN